MIVSATKNIAIRVGVVKLEKARSPTSSADTTGKLIHIIVLPNTHTIANVRLLLLALVVADVEQVRVYS
ncbi:hypothetical protein NIES4106_44440 [Fischerella sp. NIES-4106]|nr:hypothetical protein NIES4106_44440 [Fischerella sp. NIES-4106]